MVSWSVRRSVAARIERALVDQARLAAETLSHRRPATPEELDAEADALGQLVSARITFIAPDGRVIGDSGLSADQLRDVENHGDRPEVRQAREVGLGVARRYSSTVGTDMLYVAVPVQNPAAPALSQVRLALPLTDIHHELAWIRRIGFTAAGVGLITALVFAWAASFLLSRRVNAIALAARRYAAGDFSRSARDYGRDEIGTVARVLDESIRDLARRASELSTDRARMEAILGGMAEGVLVVNNHGILAVGERCRAPHAASGRCRRGAALSRDRPSARYRGAGGSDIARQGGGGPGTAAAVRPGHRRPQRAGYGCQCERRRASYYTTLPICVAPTACVATSSPMCLTNFELRLRQSAGMWKRCWTERPIREKPGDFSRSSPDIPCAWNDWCAICSGSPVWMPARNHATTSRAQSIACSLAWKASWSHRSNHEANGSSGTSPPMRRQSMVIPRNCTTR